MKLNQDGINKEDLQLALNVRNYLIAGNRVIGDPGEGLRQTLAKLEEENKNSSNDITEWKVKNVDLINRIAKTKAGIEGEEKLCDYLSTLIKFDDKLDGLIAFASLSYELENNDKDYIPDTDILLVYGQHILILDAKNIKLKPNSELMLIDGVVMDAKGNIVLEVHPSTHIWVNIMNQQNIKLDSIDGYVCLVTNQPVDIIRTDEWYSSHTKLIHANELKEILEEWVQDKDNTLSLKMLTEISKAQIKKEKDISFDVNDIKRKFNI